MVVEDKYSVIEIKIVKLIVIRINMEISKFQQRAVWLTEVHPPHWSETKVMRFGHVVTIWQDLGNFIPFRNLLNR